MKRILISTLIAGSLLAACVVMQEGGAATIQVE
jgi:hypothetical protein